MTKNEEFYNLIEQYQYHPRMLELKQCKHHGMNRYDHSLRVAYYTYKITKRLGLNYESATKAAMLHDFFTCEVQDKGALRRLTNHPKFAVINAKKYFGLTALEEDIIKTHMFPITLTPPKFLESWIVDVVDDAASIYERCCTMKFELKAATDVLLLLILSIRK